MCVCVCVLCRLPQNTVAYIDLYRRYGNARVRYAVCSIIMQRVVGMGSVSREDQQIAHAYAERKMRGEAPSVCENEGDVG